MGELRKLRFGGVENDITPYTAGDDTINISAGRKITVNTDVIATKKDLEELKIGLYGAKWDRLTNQLTRMYLGKDITTDTSNFGHFGSVNPNYDNPFDNIYPWSEMFQCNVDLAKYRSGKYTLKECIIAAYGDPGFTYAGSEDVFVGRYRPEFWYKSYEDEDGNVYYLVSEIERGDFEYAEETIDGISFCVDVGDEKVTAGSGIPLTNIAVSQIHARAKASGFTLQDIRSIDQIIILYLVEYANMNSQMALGNGCSSNYRENAADIISGVSTSGGVTSFSVPNNDGLLALLNVGSQLDFGNSVGATTYKGIVTSATVNGSNINVVLDRTIGISNGMNLSVHGFTACEFNQIASSVGNASGYIGANGHANVFYRGALLFANRYSYTLGIYRETGTNHIWLCPENLNPDDYDALDTSAHVDTGVALPTLAASAWQTVGGNAQRIEGLAAFMATGAAQGSSSSPVGDQQYVPTPSAGNTILLFGCSASSGWACGAFGGSWDRGAGSSGWNRAGLPRLKKTL